MISPKVIKYLVYVGIVLAFLAVPVGSYLIVKSNNEKMAALNIELSEVKSQVTKLEERIQFQEEVSKAEKLISENLEKQRLVIDEIDRQFEDVIVNKTDRTESSLVLKNTIEVLKRNVK